MRATAIPIVLVIFCSRSATKLADACKSLPWERNCSWVAAISASVSTGSGAMGSGAGVLLRSCSTKAASRICWKVASSNPGVVRALAVCDSTSVRFLCVPRFNLPPPKEVQLALQTQTARPQALDSSSLGQAKLCLPRNVQSAFCSCDYGDSSQEGQFRGIFRGSWEGNSYQDRRVTACARLCTFPTSSFYLSHRHSLH